MDISDLIRPGLPIATISKLGGIIVGNNLEVTPEGRLNALASGLPISSENLTINVPADKPNLPQAIYAGLTTNFLVNGAYADIVIADDYQFTAADQCTLMLVNAPWAINIRSATAGNQHEVDATDFVVNFFGAYKVFIALIACKQFSITLNIKLVAGTPNYGLVEYANQSCSFGVEAGNLIAPTNYFVFEDWGSNGAVSAGGVLCSGRFKFINSSGSFSTQYNQLLIDSDTPCVVANADEVQIQARDDDSIFSWGFYGCRGIEFVNLVGGIKSIYVDSHFNPSFTITNTSTSFTLTEHDASATLKNKSSNPIITFSGNVDFVTNGQVRWHPMTVDDIFYEVTGGNVKTDGSVLIENVETGEFSPKFCYKISSLSSLYSGIIWSWVDSGGAFESYCTDGSGLARYIGRDSDMGIDYIYDANVDVSTDSLGVTYQTYDSRAPTAIPALGSRLWNSLYNVVMYYDHNPSSEGWKQYVPKVRFDYDTIAGLDPEEWEGVTVRDTTYNVDVYCNGITWKPMQDVLVYRNAGLADSVSSTTTESVLRSVLLPALYITSGRMNIRACFTGGPTNNNKERRLRLGTTSTDLTGMVIVNTSTATSASPYSGYDKRVEFLSYNSQFSMSPTNTSDGNSGAEFASNTSSIDVTTNPCYLVVTGKPATNSANDSITLTFLSITLEP